MATDKLHNTVSKIYQIPGTEHHIDFSCVRAITDIGSHIPYRTSTTQYFYFMINCIEIEDIKVNHQKEKVAKKIRNQVVEAWYKYKNQ